MITTRLCSIFNPDQYQGWNRRKGYFEGWYFKVLNENETKAFAIIPGIAIDDRGKGQAFIQVLDGKKKTARYHQFGIEEFSPSPDKFNITIQNNNFSLQSLRLDLPELKGELHFTNLVKWPNQWYSPGIMGPYTFLPLMECFHGILSMNHVLSGHLEVENEHFDFKNGRGYTEKDWGQSFPSAYIWLQSNHFNVPEISLKVSVAKIPYLGYSFVGFIAGIWLRDRLIQFTTYNRSRLIKSLIDTEKVELVIERKKFRLEILVRREATTVLASPILGLMDGRIEESMNARIEVNLIDRKSGQSIFNDVGRNAGLEVAGKIEEIMIL